MYKDTQVRGFDWKADKIVANYLGCLTYDKNKCFSALSQPAIVNNESQQVDSRNPCILPFKYKDKEYSSCTRLAKTDTRFWCATSVDAGLNMQTFGYCQDCPREGTFYI